MRKFIINVNGNSYEVEVNEITDKVVQPATYKSRPDPTVKVNEVIECKEQEAIESPMPGKICKVLVSEGDIVKEGQILIMLEAMKMENQLVSPKDGIVSKVLTSEGISVNTGEKLIIIE